MNGERKLFYYRLIVMEPANNHKSTRYRIKQIHTEILDNRSDNRRITHTVKIRIICGIASVHVDFFANFSLESFLKTVFRLKAAFLQNFSNSFLLKSLL